MGDRGSVGMRIQRIFVVTVAGQVYGYITASEERVAMNKALKWAKQQGLFTRSLQVRYLPRLLVTRPEKVPIWLVWAVSTKDGRPYLRAVTTGSDR